MYNISIEILFEPDEYSTNVHHVENGIREIIEGYMADNNISCNYTVMDNTYIPIVCNKTNREIKQIRQDSILYLEKSNHKVVLHTHGGKHTVYSSLRKFEEQLNPRKFMRVHQGYIVNITEIRAIYSNSLLVMPGNKRIPVSRRNRQKLHSFFT